MEVFVEVMGYLHHWSCLGKGFINVNDIQSTHLWALLFGCMEEGRSREGVGMGMVM